MSENWSYAVNVCSRAPGTRGGGGPFRSLHATDINFRSLELEEHDEVQDRHYLDTILACQNIRG